MVAGAETIACASVSAAPRVAGKVACASAPAAAPCVAGKA